MDTVIKAARPEELLAIVPTLVGLQPVDSAVFVAFRGKRSRGALRITLPPDDHLAASAAANWAIGTLCKIREVDALALVIYSSRAAAGDGASRLVAAVLHAADSAGFAVREALWVDSASWGSYFAPEAGPRPLTLVEDALERHRAAGSRIPESPTLAARARLHHELDREYLREFDAALEGLDPVESLEAAFDAVVRMLDRLLTRDAASRCPVSAEDAATLVGLSHSPVLRDVMILHCAFGGGAVSPGGPDEIARSVLPSSEQDHSAEYGDSLERACRLLVGEGPRPDRDRLERAIELFSWLAAAADELSAPALTVLAWLHWACGLGSVAGMVLDRALEVEPGYGMAELLQQLLHSGRLPEWAFNDDA